MLHHTTCPHQRAADVADGEEKRFKTYQYLEWPECWMNTLSEVVMEITWSGTNADWEKLQDLSIFDEQGEGGGQF